VKTKSNLETIVIIQEKRYFGTWLSNPQNSHKMQKWCLGCNFIVANTQLSLFYLEIFVARLLRGGVLQNINTDNQ
jgi:hypothetical protein